MNPVVRDILYNISARAKGLPLKTIDVGYSDILEVFLLPLFQAKYNFTEDYSYLIYTPYSLMKVSSDDIELAVEMLGDELDDDTPSHYNYDWHHTINKGIEWWEDDLIGRIFKYAGIEDEYKAAINDKDFDDKYNLDVLISKYGWKNLITTEDDVKFEQLFFKYYKHVIDYKKKEYEELKAFFDDYTKMMFGE